MTQYVDSSALLSKYLEESASDRAVELLGGDDVVTARHTIIEVRRNLMRQLGRTEASAARRQFAEDLESMTIVELDGPTCELAASIAEQTGVRTLDALHLGAARRLGTGVRFLTFDIRQADAARRLGFTVLGA